MKRGGRARRREEKRGGEKKAVRSIMLCKTEVVNFSNFSVHRISSMLRVAIGEGPWGGVRGGGLEFIPSTSGL